MSKPSEDLHVEHIYVLYYNSKLYMNTKKAN